MSVSVEWTYGTYRNLAATWQEVEGHRHAEEGVVALERALRHEKLELLGETRDKAGWLFSSAKAERGPRTLTRVRKAEALCGEGRSTAGSGLGGGAWIVTYGMGVPNSGEAGRDGGNRVCGGGVAWWLVCAGGAGIKAARGNQRQSFGSRKEQRLYMHIRKSISRKN